jgi:hypothetical protein
VPLSLSSISRPPRPGSTVADDERDGEEAEEEEDDDGNRNVTAAIIAARISRYSRNRSTPKFQHLFYSTTTTCVPKEM